MASLMIKCSEKASSKGGVLQAESRQKNSGKKSVQGALLALSLVALGGCKLNVSVSGEGLVTSDNGKIECPGKCKASLKRGKEITLTAAAAEGSYFAGWQGCHEVNETLCTVVGSTSNRRVTASFASDAVLEEAKLSNDLKNCLIDQKYDLQEKTSAVTSLSCDGTIVDFGGNFDPAGVNLLASLTELEIRNTTLDSLRLISSLSNLKTLKLVNLGLSDVSELLKLPVGNLKTLDLQENPSLDCITVGALRERFGYSNVYASLCN
ncbi:hypothetical protein HDN1F_01300 [gamma proteobacterium HdN1]|nr:hypothetical protein HDN1F_01300 [gamma proteobacterium HdN1]